MTTPIAEIVGGVLRWHIPEDSYALPLKYLRGTHMLYDAEALAAKDAEIARLRADVHSCHANCDRAGCVNGRMRAEIELLKFKLDRLNLQSTGAHPAPCARSCEAPAFYAHICQLKRDFASLKKAMKGTT